MGGRHEEAGAGRKPSGGPELSGPKLWSSLWSHAIYDLGIPEERFWRLSPRQLGLLTSRFERRQQREELLIGLLGSVTANYGFRAPDEPLSATDLIFSGKQRAEDESDEAIAARINAQLMAVARPAA